MIIAIKTSVSGTCVCRLSPRPQLCPRETPSLTRQRRGPNAYHKHRIIGREFNRQRAKRNRRSVKRHRASGSHIRLWSLKRYTYLGFTREPVSKYFQETSRHRYHTRLLFSEYGLLPNFRSNAKRFLEWEILMRDTFFLKDCYYICIYCTHVILSHYILIFLLIKRCIFTMHLWNYFVEDTVYKRYISRKEKNIIIGPISFFFWK